MLKSHLKSNSGQSIFEILPAMMIFFTLLSGALAYYRVLRNATIKQEVVRNIAFAKINNSGTLTTPPNYYSSLTSLNVEGVQSFVSNSNNNPIVAIQNVRKDNCFTVYPDDSSAQLSLRTLPGNVDLGSLSFQTYAVLYRDVSSSGKCPNP